MKLENFEGSPYFADEDIINKLNSLKTVEEVEQLRCIKCSSDKHWGWCDAFYNKCIYKERIREILGNPEPRIKSITEDPMFIRACQKIEEEKGEVL